MLNSILSVKPFLLVLLSLFLCFHRGYASHVVGGNLEMTADNKLVGRYTVALNMYFDDINQDVGGAPQANALVFVYRKADNKRITSFYIPGVSRRSVSYANQTCATFRNIKTTLYRYEGTVDWKPADYSDEGGYYLTWQYCCRNGDINNIANPSLAGQTFYLEFPALLQNGKAVHNSSPIFTQVDGEFMCVNDPSQFSFNAKDPDGDELRYTLDTPLDRLDPDLGVGSQNGLTVQWLPNFGADKAIPGNPPLRVNRQTGELTVTPNQVGLFVFTVVVEEFRQGKKIGLVRRDYQLLVVDCPPVAPPDPSITLNDQPVTSIQVCEGKAVTMKATDNANWAYQWKKDGYNISGATSATLTTLESGTYQLVTSLKTQCSKSRSSKEVNVLVTKSHYTIQSQDPLRICGPSGFVRLEAGTGTGLVYQWYFNGQRLPDNTVRILAKEPGLYWAIARDNSQGCITSSDTVQINRATLPAVSITSPQAKTAICMGDSLRLTAPYQPTYRYQWSVNGMALSGSTTNTVVVGQGGQYAVTVTDTSTCQGISPLFTVAVKPVITVAMDSIPKQCGLTGTTIRLKATPTGGFFSGPGVSGDAFDPVKAGIGHHVLTYTVQSDLSCPQGEARQTAVVAAPSVVLSPARPTTEICIGDSLQLTALTPLDPVHYHYTWKLDGQTLVGKESIQAFRSGTYQVTVFDEDGCAAQSSPYSLSLTTTIQVMMDAVPSFCGTDHAPIPLSGYPANGVFSGPGVTGNQYDPQAAGIGAHVLTYVVNGSAVCQNGKAQRVAIIQALPEIDLGPDIHIGRGTSIQLHSGTHGSYTYQWTPPTDLSNPFISDPQASPQQSTWYTLTVTDSYGCSASDSVAVTVYERIWIPDAFSPNGDGVNERWELRGIETYPQAEVTVFNRWGQVVFFSQGYKQPFDGTYQQSVLPSCLYTYQIKPSPTEPVLQGKVVIIW